MSYLRSYQEILDQIDAIDPVAYARSRNHLEGAVTRLSPYITRGIITLPFVRDRLLEKHKKADCEKLIQELAWREYFQNVWWAKGEEIFSDLRFPRSDWRHNELVSALVGANTGITVIDEAVKNLYNTGYLHNHERMWIAAIACNGAKANWYEMGRWMYYHLIDGDMASNFLSWQWVAGTSVNKRYTVNQALINGCSTASETTWLSGPREEILEQVPETLLISEPADFVMDYSGQGSTIDTLETTTCVYIPWTLDPTWRAQEDARRILIIDPTWFNRFPVSPSVLDFIIRQGKTVIPKLEVHVGTFETLPGITLVDSFTKRHQTNQEWLTTFDEPERLYPLVTEYYPSFFAYFKNVTQYYK